MSSTSFFAVYVALCGGLYVANMWLWRRAERASARPGAPARLEPYGLALLNGGPCQVVATAVAMLRGRGQLTDGVAPGILAVTGKTDTPAHPLERAVCEAVGRAGQLPSAALDRDAAVRAAIERIRLQLTRSGELIDRRTIDWVRAVWLGGPVVLVALGTVRLATAWDYGDEAMRWLLLTVLCTAAVMVSHIIDQLAFDGRPLPSARGRTALADWGKRDPAASFTEDERIALTAALTDQSEALAVTTREARHAQTSGAVHMTLADEILLLGGLQNPDERPPIETGTLLAGALLVELAALGRLTVATPPGENEPFVTVLDREPIGDKLLDDALALLADPGPATTGDHSDSWRLLGSMSRRRLRARSRVSERDLVAWWRDAWTCAEFPELAPTLLRQILTLHERLHPVEDLVATRLVASGALRQRFAGPWPYLLVAHDVRDELRRRTHAAALALDPRLEPRTTYLVAICATYTNWLTDAVSADGNDAKQIRASARIALRRDPVARTVDVIVRKGYAAFDDWAE